MNLSLLVGGAYLFGPVGADAGWVDMSPDDVLAVLDPGKGDLDAHGSAGEFVAAGGSFQRGHQGKELDGFRHCRSVMCGGRPTREVSISVRTGLSRSAEGRPKGKP